MSGPPCSASLRLSFFTQPPVAGVWRVTADGKVRSVRVSDTCSCI